MNFYQQSVEELIQELQTNKTNGLSLEEVQKRKSEYVQQSIRRRYRIALYLS